MIHELGFDYPKWNMSFTARLLGVHRIGIGRICVCRIGARRVLVDRLLLCRRLLRGWGRPSSESCIMYLLATSTGNRWCLKVKSLISIGMRRKVISADSI